jgi:hypothetical protein
LVVLAACGGEASITAPPPVQPKDTATSFAGFDIGLYPGDGSLQAWKYPASPYRWVGYYLPSPCHRDASFVGKRQFMTSLGWGLAVLYVGQQDWANMSVAPSARGNAVELQAVCSASLLSAEQGTAEAADAVARTRAEGFADGTTIFLDVEHVNSISAPMLEYYRAWIAGVLNDGHFKPGVYAHKVNAPTFYDQSIADLHGARYTPPFWIASWSNFSITSKPTDVGISFAQLWQGLGNVTQTFGGITLNIDVNVATKTSPSAP